MQFNQGNNPDPIFHIETDKIKPNPYQPRKNFDPEALNELANSIREYGLLHPLVVTKIETVSPNGTNVEYQLISGERRLMASKLVGLERVPVIIRSAPTERERLELAIIENIQRENLNPLETARAYVKLQEQFGLTQREIAVRVGKSRESVANTMRLLNLPSFAQDALSNNHINESQARLLLMVSDLKEQQLIFNDLISNNLSVRELRTRIKNKKPVLDSAQQGQSSVKSKTDPEISSLEEQLMEVLGTKVKVQSEGDGGRLTINFYSKEELQGIIDKLVQKRTNALHREQNFVSGLDKISENLINKIPEASSLSESLISSEVKTEENQENYNLPNKPEIEMIPSSEESLLEQRVPDPYAEELPMIIRHDDLPVQPEDDFTI
jgi:ParB family chromosome partitioning protein